MPAMPDAHPLRPVDPDVAAARAVVAAASPRRPRVGVIAGSGLSDLDAALEDAVRLPYDALPGWPAATVLGHAGELALGRLGGIDVAIARGRAHLYEGRSPRDVTFGTRLLRALGVETLVVTNAAGGLNDAFAPGDVMVIRDHIFWPGLAGANPLVGPNDDAVGPRFPSLLDAYDPALRRAAAGCLADAGLTVREGVYAMVAGPSFETPAEARLLRLAGADAVGMSTCPEVIVARHGGLEVVGISVITNRVPLEPPAVPVTADLHAEVLEAGRAAAGRLAIALVALVEAIERR